MRIPLKRSCMRSYRISARKRGMKARNLKKNAELKRISILKGDLNKMEKQVERESIFHLEASNQTSKNEHSDVLDEINKTFNGLDEIKRTFNGLDEINRTFNGLDEINKTFNGLESKKNTENQLIFESLSEENKEDTRNDNTFLMVDKICNSTLLAEKVHNEEIKNIPTINTSSNQLWHDEETVDADLKEKLKTLEDFVASEKSNICHEKSTDGSVIMPSHNTVISLLNSDEIAELESLFQTKNEHQRKDELDSDNLNLSFPVENQKGKIEENDSIEYEKSNNKPTFDDYEIKSKKQKIDKEEQNDEISTNNHPNSNEDMAPRENQYKAVFDDLVTTEDLINSNNQSENISNSLIKNEIYLKEQDISQISFSHGQKDSNVGISPVFNTESHMFNVVDLTQNKDLVEDCKITDALNGKLQIIQMDLISLNDSINKYGLNVSSLLETQKSRIISLSDDFLKQKEAFEMGSLENVEKVTLKSNLEASSFIYEVSTTISKFLSEINLMGLFQKVEKISILFSDLLIKNEAKLTEQTNLEESLHKKTEELEVINKTNGILKARAEMLEENVDYLNRQNEKLSFRNHQMSISLNTIATHVENIRIFTSEFSGFGLELFQMYGNLENLYFSKFQELCTGLSNFKLQMVHLKNQVDSLKFDNYKVEFEKLEHSIVKLFQNQDAFNENQMKLLTNEIQDLNHQIYNLKEENIILKDCNKEVRDDLQLKEIYFKDLEKSIDELLKSNKFYEDQLIKSDEIIKTLKDGKMSKVIELSVEIEKIKKHYMKENGLLKLRIHELEQH